MEHITVNCSSCNRELKIKVAKGENAPDKTTCKACSQGILPIKVNLAKAQSKGKFWKLDRAIKGSE